MNAADRREVDALVQAIEAATAGLHAKINIEHPDLLGEAISRREALVAAGANASQFAELCRLRVHDTSAAILRQIGEGSPRTPFDARA